MSASRSALGLGRTTEPKCSFNESTFITSSPQGLRGAETGQGASIGSLLTPPRGYGHMTEIGQGATSRVFSATEIQSGRTAALKQLKPGLVGYPEVVDAFLAEAVLLSGLRHPLIIRCFDYFWFGGTWWIDLEYAEGGTLATASRGYAGTHQQKKWLSQLAEAISFLHSRKIIHRDIKPANVLIRNGNAVLADFGVSGRESELQKRRPHICGTLRYMSPQAAAGDISPDNDWFAFLRTAEDIGLKAEEAIHSVPHADSRLSCIRR